MKAQKNFFLLFALFFISSIRASDATWGRLALVGAGCVGAGVWYAWKTSDQRYYDPQGPNPNQTYSQASTAAINAYLQSLPENIRNNPV